MEEPNASLIPASVLKIIETIWRGGVLACGAFFLIAAGAWTFVFLEAGLRGTNDYDDPSLSYDRRLRLAVSYPNNACNPTEPIGVTITNLRINSSNPTHGLLPHMLRDVQRT
jgi:hypothetical protein